MDDVEDTHNSSESPESLTETIRPAISIKNISKSFGPQKVLADVSLDIRQGELLVVLGSSGSGKTTLLRIVAGLVEADAGDIYLCEHWVNHLPPQERNMGVVFQDHALFQHLSVEQNIAFGLKLRKVTSSKVQKIVDEMVEFVRLQKHRRKYPRQLSGGERQRVAIARALAYSPQGVLLDEPFSALDPVTRSELRREVRRLLKAMNVPALFITHDQEEALEMADRIAILNDGRIEQIGTPYEVYNHPRNEFVASFLGVANVLLGRWQEGQVAVGALRLKAPPDAPALSERQLIKVVFRPEDVSLNFQPQFLDTPFYLGRGVVEELSYVGPTERLAVRLSLWPPRNSAADASDQRPKLYLVDETYAEGFPIVVYRTKWEASDMELSMGDPVVLGLKHYHLLPHYPLHSESGAKVVG